MSSSLRVNSNVHKINLQSNVRLIAYIFASQVEKNGAKPLI